MREKKVRQDAPSVVQVREEHVLGDGLGQRRHGLVVLRDDLRGGQAQSDQWRPRAELRA